jgi:UDP-N-acetylglucosamine--N-acetylmuramyl-(pentapeptide) pyrophosphoryl-undecaprenol N-acetylglucosamine transferase
MKVLLVAGASGGHIFPALALASHLQSRGCETLLVIPRKNSVTAGALQGVPVAMISVEAVRPRVRPDTLRAVARFVRGCWESMRVVNGFSPDVAVGFGSIASIPVMLLCWLFRIRTVLHEQNVTPGKANRFLAGFCDRICVSFAESRDYFSSGRGRITVTGNPLRARLKILPRGQALSFFSFKEGRSTILVMGGSQGSARVNRASISALSSAVEPEAIQVIHICGKDNAEAVRIEYARLRIEARVFDFLEEMEYAFSCADLVVCRAGATTVTELEFFRVPAVILPYPYASAHQLQNARVLKECGAALIIEDADIEGGALARGLNDLLDHRERLAGMRASYGSPPERTAVEELARVVLD